MFIQIVRGVTFAFLLFVLSSCMSVVNIAGLGSSELQEVTLKKGEGSQKILLIDLVGEISLDSEDSFFRKNHNTVQRIVTRLDLARKDPKVAAVVLRINSPGGGVTASEMLYYEIKKFRETTKKPIYAYVVNMAASGGYYAAMACHKIFAPSSALVGSIGVISLQPEITELAQKVGVHVQVTKSGRNKDMTSPFRKLTKEEKKIKQEMVNTLAKNFLDVVVKERKIKDTTKKKRIGTARVFLADEAKNLGLVDEVMLFDELVEEMSKKLLFKEGGSPRLIAYKGNGSMKKGLYNFSTREGSAGYLGLDSSPVLRTFMRSGFYYIAE